MQRLQVSDNGRFLVHADGSPFFWLADTAWELFHRCDADEAEHYLEQRRQQGFNVIQAVALGEADSLRVPNRYGELPLHNADPAAPNEAHFRFVDAVIERAAAKGLYVGLLPTWGDKVNSSEWGAGPEIFDPHSAFAYGAWIGRRYRDHANVIWINGGDRAALWNGRDDRETWRALARGIRSAYSDVAPLITYHPRGGQSSSWAFHEDEWLSFNMWQSGHMQPDAPIWESISADYARTPIKPVLDGEPNYEDHPINPFTRAWDESLGRFRDHDVRKQAYRAVFAGACGHTYGHHSVWQFYTPAYAPANYPDPTWTEALVRPGASQMIHLRRLIESRPFLSRVPDQALIVGDAGEGGAHMRATRDETGSYALIYLPMAGQIVEVDVRRLNGAHVRAAWFNPSDGGSQPIDDYPTESPLRFTAPAHAPDWVLTLDMM
jgi:hypothetical protein